jgi:integrase
MQQEIKPNSLAEVVTELMNDQDISEARRRDLISACKSTGRLVGLPLSDVRADIPVLRSLLSKVHPVKDGVSRKRLSNIKSDLAEALVRSRASFGLVNELAATPSEGWRAFLDTAEQPYQKWTLGRFSRYCTLQQAEPSQVDQALLERYRALINEYYLCGDPAKIIKSTVVSFNVIVKKGGHGFAPLRQRERASYVSAPMSRYPVSLQADLNSYLDRLEKPDLFSEDAVMRPLRPMTLRNIRAHIRQILDAAVLAGIPPDQFQSLADIIDFQVLERAFEQIRSRHEGGVPTTLSNIMGSLLAIAKHYVKCPAATLSKMQAAQKKLQDKTGYRTSVMSMRARQRMTQFEDPENIARLVNLPQQLIARADSRRGTHRASIDAMTACAITILLACPIRINNLANLVIGKHLKPMVKGKVISYSLHVDAAETKNRLAIDSVIEPPFANVIQRYFERHRKHLGDTVGDWVFPAVSGGPRTPGHLGPTIKDKIFREIGIDLNVHSFRHFCAEVFLEHYPGFYEDVRRLVGHSKLETTTTFYAPQSAKAAQRRYADILNKSYRR